MGRGGCWHQRDHEPLRDTETPWRVFDHTYMITFTLSKDRSGCSTEDHLTWGEGQGLSGGRVTAEEVTAVSGRAGAACPHRIVTLLG